jgi:hypothetical protein
MAWLPRSADLVWAFAEPAGVDGEHRHPVLAAAGRLARGHGDQWTAEDACRDPTADDHVVAATKRAIDAMNEARVAAVDAIDAWAADTVRGPAEAALHTETLGCLVDRLAVAWVRSQRMVERASAAPDGRDDARRALTMLAQLCDAYDDLARDLQEGRRRLPVWRSLKRYGPRR